MTEIFARFQAAEPEPKGELTSLNAFTFLVAVVLSAQSTDAGVNKATPALFALADTPEKMVALGEDRVRDLIKTVGLFRTKAKNIVALSKRLVDAFGGSIPDTREALESLPGVGRKTANVVLNNAYGVAVIAVDTHLFRVSNRIPIAIGANPLAVELGLEKAIAEPFKRHAHHWLILHGRYVCKARADLRRLPHQRSLSVARQEHRDRVRDGRPLTLLTDIMSPSGEPEVGRQVGMETRLRRKFHEEGRNTFFLQPWLCIDGPRQAERDRA